MVKKNLRHTLKGHEETVTRIAWSPDGKLLASGADDKTIGIWDLDGNRFQTFVSPYDTMKNLVWSPDGASMLISSIYDDFYIMDARSGVLQGKVSRHAGWVTSLAWSPNGELIVSASADGIICIWYANNCVLQKSFEADTNLIHCVSWSPDGRFLASSSTGPTIRLWDTNSWKLIRKLRGHSNSVDCLAWAPNTQKFASASSDNTIVIWDPEEEKNIKTLKSPKRNFTNIAFSLDGSLLASMDEEGYVHLWCCYTWEIIDTIDEKFAGKLRGGLAFNPRMPILASICQKKRMINVYDIEIEDQSNNESLNESSDNNIVCPSCDEVIACRIVSRRKELGHTAMHCPMCDTSIQIGNTQGHGSASSTADRLTKPRSSKSKTETTQPTAKVANIKDEKPLFGRRPDIDQKVPSKHSDDNKSFRAWAGSSKCTLAFVFTDVLGSTKLCAKLGNEEFNILRQAHFAQAHRLINKHNGYAIKTIGDSVMATFRAASEAFDFALEFYTNRGDDRIKIRAGIHVGPVSIEENDAFGITVNYTARIEKMAHASEIWISNEAKTHIDQEGSRRHAEIQWLEHPDCKLKGFEGRHMLWSVTNLTV